MAASQLVHGADVGVARSPSPSALWAIAVVGSAAAFAVAAITYGIDAHAPLIDAAIVAWITLSYVVCGLIAWSRRPQSRFGRLMVASGFGPLLSRLSAVDASLAQ